MKISDIKKGDIVYYRNGGINYVNKPYQYCRFFNDDFKNIEMQRYEIEKIQRYVKCLWFYRLKTIYKRKNKDDRK